MFQLLDNVKRGRRTNSVVTSLVDVAMTRSESLLHTDLEKGLRYFRLAEQHYQNMDPQSPRFEEMENRIGELFVAYYKKQAGLV